MDDYRLTSASYELYERVSETVDRDVHQAMCEGAMLDELRSFEDILPFQFPYQTQYEIQSSLVV